MRGARRILTGAVQELRRVICIKPSNARGHWWGLNELIV